MRGFDPANGGSNLLLYLEPLGFVMALGVMGLLAASVSIGLNAILDEDGFGTTGNAVILMGGIVIGEALIPIVVEQTSGNRSMIGNALISGFSCLAISLFVKAVFKRYRRVRRAPPSA